MPCAGESSCRCPGEIHFPADLRQGAGGPHPRSGPDCSFARGHSDDGYRGGTPSVGLSLRPRGVLSDFIDSFGPLRIVPSPGEHSPGVCFSGPFPVFSRAGCFVFHSPVSFLRASASLRGLSFASGVSSRSRIPRAFIFRWRWLRSSPTWAAVRETFQANSSSLRSR